MEKFSFDVIIPVAFKDYNILKKTIPYIIRNLSPKKIYIITDIRFKRFIPKLKGNIIIIDENKLVPELSFNQVKELLVNHCGSSTRTGWYLQQFIKMAFSYSKYCNKEFYLSWDADTVPLRKIDFFPNGKVAFTMKKEKHEPYFNVIKRLLNIVNFNDSSYIAEHMMFNRDIMKHLINQISLNDVKGGNWVEKIINSTSSIESNAFSEFETYGNYCLNYFPDVYVERSLNTFRKGGFIAGRFISEKKLNYISFDTDTISFEFGDFPDILFARLLCFLYKKYVELEYRILKRIL